MPYHDFAAASCEGEDETGHQDQSSTHFPTQLHYVLQELQREGKSDIASWLTHGRAFRVHPGQKGRFMSEVQQTWFRQNKYASFQRQLSLYGFKRIMHGRDKGAYYNELFLRSKKSLCRRMKRTLNKSRSPEALRGMDEPEPDFYAMPSLPEESPANAASPVASAAAPSDIKPPAQAWDCLQTPSGSLAKLLHGPTVEAQASPAVLAPSSVQSDISTMTICLPTPILTSLIRQQSAVLSSAAVAATIAGDSAMFVPNAQRLLEPQSLLPVSHHAAAAAAALLTSQAQTHDLQRLWADVGGVPPQRGQEVSSLSRGLYAYQHPLLLPQLSQTIHLPSLNGLVQQQFLLRQLQSLQPPPRSSEPQKRRPADEWKFTDYTG